MAKERAIIVDLDGTVALTGWRNPYDAAKSDQDPPNVPVVETVHALVLRGYYPIFVSGREDKFRDPTERFLKKHFPAYEYQLYMRKSGDFRKDATVKEEIYRNHIEYAFDVLLCLDDRKVVTAKWREMGLTVLQCAEGDY